jgi:uncharacterized protein involved in exopolysaccharide biosynthesis
MNENKNIQLIDYFVLLVKWKKLLLFIFIISTIISYLFIYFFIEEQFESSAVILPAKETEITGISNVLKNIKGLPFGLPSTINNELDLYSTIVNSRTVLDKVIKKFDLVKVFEIDSSQKDCYERTLKILRNSIDTKTSEEQVFEITVTLNSPTLSADVANYIVKILNDTLVELEISKSKNNREFLENRLLEVRNNLKISEDYLKDYQKKSGMLDAKEQIKGIISVYSELETQLISKQIEFGIYQKIFGKNSPQFENSKIQLKEYEDKLAKIKKEGQEDSYLLALNSLPQKAIDYIRHYRDVEINSAILEFLVPLYEQAKFDEQKDIPVLQVLDEAIPPAKKSYPPRVIFSTLVGFAVFLFCFFCILISENDNLRESEKFKYIRKNLFNWRKLK